MPRPPKPRTLRQNRERRDVGVIALQGDAPPVPNAPPGILASLRRAWSDFWASSLAQVVVPASDMQALTRLWRLYDERERAYRAGRAERLVEGSQGQPRLNPLLRYVADLDAEIRQLEDRFGLTPLARLRLGVVLGEAHRSLDDLNALLEADDDETDLRLTYAEPPTADARPGSDQVDGDAARPRARRQAG